MISILYIIIGILLIGFAALLYFLFDLKRKTEKPIDNEPMKLMMEWMKEIKSDTEATRESTNRNIAETNKQIN